jgi:hypothetical protein
VWGEGWGWLIKNREQVLKPCKRGTGVMVRQRTGGGGALRKGAGRGGWWDRGGGQGMCMG